MTPEQRPYVEELYERIGASAIVELCRLLYQNDMTPPEARLWMEPPDHDWPEVERLLCEIYEHRYPDWESLPAHIVRWAEQYREANPKRFSSLFD